MLGLEDPVGVVHHCTPAVRMCRRFASAQVLTFIACRLVSRFVVGVGGKMGAECCHAESTTSSQLLDRTSWGPCGVCTRELPDGMQRPARHALSDTVGTQGGRYIAAKRPVTFDEKINAIVKYYEYVH